MAYIRSKDGHVKPTGQRARRQREIKLKSAIATFDYNSDLDGEDDLQEHEQDRIFQKRLETEFPLSGGETEDGE